MTRRRKRQVEADRPSPIITQRLANPLTRQDAAVELGDLIKKLCLVMGCEITTAYAVGGAFAAGIAKSWDTKETESGLLLKWQRR